MKCRPHHSHSQEKYAFPTKVSQSVDSMQQAKVVSFCAEEESDLLKEITDDTVHKNIDRRNHEQMIRANLIPNQ